MSLMLCTAKSAFSSSTALSTSFSKTPFSFTEKSSLFLLISPLDFILTISHFTVGYSFRKLLVNISVCISASLLPRVATLATLKLFNSFHFFQCFCKRFNGLVNIFVIMRVGNKTSLKLRWRYEYPGF